MLERFASKESTRRLLAGHGLPTIPGSNGILRDDAHALDTLELDGVLLLSNTAGTYLGGWRIIRTLGWSIIKLEPVTGLAAQFTGASVIQAATLVGLPVSTTHVVTGSVMGVGAIRKLSAVSWGLGANIALAWLVTIPAASTWIAFVSCPPMSSTVRVPGNMTCAPSPWQRISERICSFGKGSRARP